MVFVCAALPVTERSGMAQAVRYRPYLPNPCNSGSDSRACGAGAPGATPSPPAARPTCDRRHGQPPPSP